MVRLYVVSIGMRYLRVPSVTESQVFPTYDATITVGPSDTSAFSQVWSMSISNGYNCEGYVFTPVAVLGVNHEDLVSTGQFFQLPTYWTTLTAAFPQITSASLTPQVMQIVHLRATSLTVRPLDTQTPPTELTHGQISIYTLSISLM